MHDKRQFMKSFMRELKDAIEDEEIFFEIAFSKGKRPNNHSLDYFSFSVGDRSFKGSIEIKEVEEPES